MDVIKLLFEKKLNIEFEWNKKTSVITDVFLF